jgi:biotin carboxylase
VSTLLILGASVSQRPGILRARELGVRVVAVDADPFALGSTDADVFEAVDFSDVPSVIDVARRHAVDGVLAISTDRAVPVAAAVAEARGLSGIGLATARAMTHKGVMRQRLAEARVPQPTFTVIRRDDDLEAALAVVGTPAVIKPVDSGGQRGLFVVENVGELAAQLPLSLEHSREQAAMLERFVLGDELNVMAVVTDGDPHVLTVSDRLRPPGAGFGVGWAHAFPSHLDAAVIERASVVAVRAVEALGLENGIAFPQLLVQGNDVVVIEVAARVAAGQMADLVRHGVGTDLIKIAIIQALGQTVPADELRPRFERPIAIRFLTAQPGPLPAGRLRSVSGLDQVRNAAGVLDAGLYLQPGERISPVRVDADRRGYVIATGTNPSEALAAADAASRLLMVEVEPLDSVPDDSQEPRAPITTAFATVFCVALLMATAVAFAITESAKTELSPIYGTKVDKLFSPVCSRTICARRYAAISFILRKPAQLQVWIEAANGDRVSTLLAKQDHPRGRVRLHFNGRTATGVVLPNGPYQPVVAVGNRTFELPNTIQLDTTPPHVTHTPSNLHTSIAPGRPRHRLLRVPYTLNKPARAVLLINGRQVELTHRLRTQGVLRWNGWIRSRLQPPGMYQVAVAAQDLAGNRSATRPVGVVTLSHG